MAVSLVAHGLFVAVVVFLGRAAGLILPGAPEQRLTFMRVIAPEPPPVVRPRPVRVQPPPVRELPKVVEAAPVKIEAPKAPERVETKADPAPAPAPVVERPALSRVEGPKTIPPTVQVGSFDVTSGAKNPDVNRSLKSAEFDAPAARATDLKIATASVGTFEQASTTGRPRPGTDRPVSDAGFGSGLAAGPNRAAGGRVVEAGFGSGGTGTGTTHVGGGGVVVAGGFDSAKADAARPPQTPQTAVKTSDFDTRAAQAQQTQAAVTASDFDARAAQAPVQQAVRQRPSETPLEIISKPTPAYTDEARRLKIEGEVVLEVEFTADGTARVMRIIRGLGHGLDESAMRAVQAMRFKPAERDGRPVDIRTTVNIVFRLA